MLAVVLATLTAPIICMGVVSAHDADLRFTDGVQYETSSDVEDVAGYLRPSGIVVTSSVTDTTYRAISPVTADWDMGDGVVYKAVKEVVHDYGSYGTYKVSVTATDGQNWTADIVISDTVDSISKGLQDNSALCLGIAGVVLFAVGGIVSKLRKVVPWIGIAVMVIAGLWYLGVLP